MFNCKAALFAALIAGILVASGALTVLPGATGRPQGPTPAQIDTFDLMSNAHGLVDQKIESLF